MNMHIHTLVLCCKCVWYFVKKKTTEFYIDNPRKRTEGKKKLV